MRLNGKSRESEEVKRSAILRRIFQLRANGNPSVYILNSSLKQRVERKELVNTYAAQEYLGFEKAPGSCTHDI